MSRTFFPVDIFPGKGCKLSMKTVRLKIMLTGFLVTTILAHGGLALYVGQDPI